MVSARPSISNSSSQLSKPLGVLPNAPITISITGIFMFHSFFRSQAISKYLSLFSFSLIFPLWLAEMAKFTIRQVCFIFYFLFTITKGWSFCRDQEICLYLKISDKFVRFLFLDGFCFVHIPFGSMVKFQFLAQFPMDHLSHPVVSSLILFLR